RLRRLRAGAPAVGEGGRGPDALPRAVPVRGGTPDVVRAPVHVQIGSAPAARARGSGGPTPGWRLRADRLQDRPPENLGRAVRGCPAVPVCSRRARGVEPRRLASGL